MTLLWGTLGLLTLLIGYFFFQRRSSTAKPATVLEVAVDSRSSEPPVGYGYAPTLENQGSSVAERRAGMVWIPGGEFSMGSDVQSESLCGLPGVTRDAVPIHRVYVDGFWMDTTEVSNAQFAPGTYCHQR